ncbi:MAG: hypothetical protein CL868_17870 [Cytophagaceae bacterium]|nr:hypothetical protein [Cytophagaceae bacterium]|tara:strand:+ start:14724 stop:15575 length:852 start_codon:yes stop_codon:yes gene_type:complete
MKNFKIYWIVLAFLVPIITGCNNDDDGPRDEIYEFVTFQKSTATIGENAGTTQALPIALDLLGYMPKNDMTVSITLDENNIEEGVDYTISAKTFTFHPGSYVSDTLYVNTIDNNYGADYERSITLKLSGSSNPDLKLGLGLENPELALMKVLIADDECTETVDIFNTSVTNENQYGTYTLDSSVMGNTLKITGDIIGYSSFSNASLEMQLNPVAEGATEGTVTFDDYVAGTDGDGYEYEFRQAGSGSYDVCAGSVRFTVDIYYMSGGAWVYWYSSVNTLTVNL